MSHRNTVELLDCRDCCTVRRSPWTALRPGVVQYGEFHSAEHAGGETVSMAITTVLSRRCTAVKNLKYSYHCEFVRDVHAPPLRPCMGSLAIWICLGDGSLAGAT